MDGKTNVVVGSLIVGGCRISWICRLGSSDDDQSGENEELVNTNNVTKKPHKNPN